MARTYVDTPHLHGRHCTPRPARAVCPRPTLQTTSLDHATTAATGAEPRNGRYSSPTEAIPGAEDAISSTDMVIGNLKQLNRLLPNQVGVATLRIICNAVNTTRRFQSAAAPCVLCGLVAGDEVEHLVECPTVVSFARTSVPGLSDAISEHGASRVFLLACALDDARLVDAAVVNDCWLYAFKSIACAGFHSRLAQ